MAWRSVCLVASVALLSACNESVEPEIHTPLWGYVTSPDGPLEAQIYAFGRRTNAVAITDGSGRYELPLSPDSYTVRAEIRNFGSLRLRQDGFDWSSSGDEPRFEIGPLSEAKRVDISLSSATITIDGLDFAEGREVTGRFSRQIAVDTVAGGSVTLTFPLVTAGEHLLEVDGGFVPGTHVASEATRFHVDPGKRASIRTAMTFEPAIVSGSVIDPFEQAFQIECRPEPADSYWIVQADSTGRFRLPVWSSRVSFVADGSFGFSERFDGVAQSIAVAPGQTVELFPLALPGIRIVPRGLHARSARFWIADERLELVEEAYSYVLGPVPIGRYFLGVSSSHWDSCQVDFLPTQCESIELCDAVEVELTTETPTREIPFELRSGAQIEGVLIGASDIRVPIDLVSDGRVICSTESRVRNSFVFSGLRTGTYFLRFTSSTGEIWYPGVASQEEATPIEIVEDGQRIQADMNWPEDGL